MVRYGALTVNNGGSKLLIFVSPATHRHNLSLSFVAGLIARSVAAKQILQEEEHGQNPIWVTRCWSSA